jgi:hypothetical protein
MDEDFDDGGGVPEDYGMTQADFDAASSIGQDTYNDNRGGDSPEDYNSFVTGKTPQQAYTIGRGASSTNPFPESFFSKMFGAENVDYTNIIGSGRINEINDLRYNQAIGGMSNRTGANTGKPYQMGDYYIGQPTQMGTVKEVPQTGIMSVMDNLPYIGAISSVMGRNRGLPENDPRRIAMMEEQAKSANDPTVFDRTSDFVKSILGLDPKDSGASLAASPVGEGQMRVPDNRTFDTFGNVTGSSLDTKDNFGFNRSTPKGYITAINPITGLEELRYDRPDTTSGIGAINKEVTNNAVNNIVPTNLPVETQAMLNVLNKDPSKLKAFEFMAGRPGISSYQGAQQALDIYNKNTI